MATFTWVETLSDLTIALSYFSIPISLASLASAQDLRISFFTSDRRLASSIKALIVLIIAFIGLCGVTHLISSVKGWVEDQVVTEVFKVLTAVVSFVTAAFLHRVLPILLSSMREIELTKRGLPAYLERINHMVFGSSGHMLSAHNADDLAFQSVNDAISSVGLCKEDVLTRNLYELVEEADVTVIKHSLEELQRVPDSTQDVKYHIWDAKALRRRTMEASMFFSQAQLSNGNNQSHVLIISKDVTDREERQAMEQERLRLTEANKTRMRYISSIAHDLKTPLTTFQLSLGLLEAGHISAEQTSIVHEAKVSVEMMSVIIGQALDSGRTEDGNQLQPKRGRVDISEMISKCEKIMSNYAKCVPLSFHIDPGVSAVVVTDGEWVWQMCINLMTNACKYTVEGYIRLDVSIVLGKYLPRADVTDPGGARTLRASTGEHLNCGSFDGGGHAGPIGIDALWNGNLTETREQEEEGGTAKSSSPPAFRNIGSRGCSSSDVCWDDSEFLCFSVSDTGIGVTNDKKSLLFKAFTQVQAMQTSVGTGLGLYSVRQKATRLRGTSGMRDNVDSAGGGSVFFFAVPYLPDSLDDSSLSADLADVEAEPAHRRDPRVATWPSLPWEGTAAVERSYDIEAPAGRLTVAASSGVSLDNTNLLNPTASCRGCVSPTPRERGRSSSSQNNELELKGRNNLAGEGGGALAVHEDRGELRRNSRNIGIEKRASVRKGDVLVVDDTSTVRSLLKRAVTRMGHGVDTACTGQEALQMVGRRAYQLVLCDLQMPVMDGPEFTQRWRVREAKGQVSPTRRGFRQKIIGMSANGEAPEIQACKDCGMDGFCPKPINLAVLRDLIDDHCTSNLKATESQHPGGASASSGGGEGEGERHIKGKPSSSACTTPTSARDAAGPHRREQSPEEASLLGDTETEEEDGPGGHENDAAQKEEFKLY